MKLIVDILVLRLIIAQATTPAILPLRNTRFTYPSMYCSFKNTVLLLSSLHNSFKQLLLQRPLLISLSTMNRRTRRYSRVRPQCPYSSGSTPYRLPWVLRCYLHLKPLFRDSISATIFQPKFWLTISNKLTAIKVIWSFFRAKYPKLIFTVHQTLSCATTVEIGRTCWSWEALGRTSFAQPQP